MTEQIFDGWRRRRAWKIGLRGRSVFDKRFAGEPLTFFLGRYGGWRLRRQQQAEHAQSELRVVIVEALGLLAGNDARGSSGRANLF